LPEKVEYSKPKQGKNKKFKTNKKKNATNHVITELEKILEDDDEYLNSQRVDDIKPLGLKNLNDLENPLNDLGLIEESQI